MKVFTGAINYQILVPGEGVELVAWAVVAGRDADRNFRDIRDGGSSVWRGTL